MNTPLRNELIDLWIINGVGVDELLLRIFDNLPEWGQREIVGIVRVEFEEMNKADSVG